MNRPRTDALLARTYRWSRYQFYRLLWPLDRVFLLMNGLGHCPPVHLRRHVGFLGSPEGNGAEFVAFLKLLLALKDGDRLWDVGCGWGMLEMALARSGWKGRIVGTDIHQPCIAWAQKSTATRVQGSTFVHADIYNDAYWPAGSLGTAEWFENFPDRNFDIIIAKSLFTHMLPEELDIYFREFTARMAPGGRALMTFFLLDEQASGSDARPRIAFTRPRPDAVYAVRRPEAPTAAVAYEKEFVLRQLRSAGLAVDSPCYRGSWTGRSDALSYQDMLIVRKQ